MRDSVFLVARTERPTGDLEKAIRRAIAAIDPSQPVFLSAPMRVLIADSVADRRFIMLLLTATGWLALLISAAGVYGVISYSTVRRTQEMGIRMALGATPRDVHSLVFREGFATVAIGLILGLCVTAPVLYTLRSFLVGLDSRNPVYVCVAIGLVIITAGLACWIPARRVTRIDPLSALRQE